MPAYDAVLFEPPAPIAYVTLRNSAGTASLPDVPMLLDSGADVTLVPDASVVALGINTATEAAYELMGFDGTKSVARAVSLDLVFLNRAFKGRFLVINQAWGILGRDILNHLAIILNGPQLSWSEAAS